MENKRHIKVRELHEVLSTQYDQDIADRIADENDLETGANKTECANWVKQIVNVLEDEFEEEEIKNIRQGCYCKYGARLNENKKWLKDIYDTTDGLDDFVHRINGYGMDWYIQDGDLITNYKECSCHMLEKVDKLETKTWCYCTIGFMKELFAHVFEEDVDVELLQAIKMGDEQCLFKISKKK